MIIFDSVVGHQNIVKNLKLGLDRKPRPNPAFLFCGPSGVGKRLVALGWAQGLLCENKDQVPCGRCSSCLRVEKGQHPDLLRIGLTEGATIKISEIRDIQNFVSLRAYESHGKVIIIDEAQSITAQASNSLLKTLEEPPENSHFVLITSNKSSIIQTIQSRCQKVLFGALSHAELKKILPQAEDWVLELSQGRVDAAAKMGDESFRKLRAQALKVLRDLAVARIFEGFTSLSDLVEDRESAQFTVQCWGQWIKLAAAVKLGAKPTMAPDERPVVEKLAAEFSAPYLLTIGEKILRLEQDIQANINKTLSFEKFWLDAHELALNSKGPAGPGPINKRTSENYV